jgi:hypothetical protein
MGGIIASLAFLNSGIAATVSVNPEADAFVTTGPTGNLSNNNYGGGGALAISASDLTNGEFQSVIRFNFAGVRSALDSQFGAGQWSVLSASLQLTSSPHNNSIYNNVSAGLFSVSLMANNSWVEGTGNASSPTSDGITYNSLLSTYINDSADQMLGTFNFPGGTSGANVYSLTPGSDLVADILGGSELSLRLFAADTSVSYLFSSRAVTPAANEPQLTIEAVPEPSYPTLLGVALGILLCRRNGFGWQLLKLKAIKES